VCSAAVSATAGHGILENVQLRVDAFGIPAATVCYQRGIYWKIEASGASCDAECPWLVSKTISNRFSMKGPLNTEPRCTLVLAIKSSLVLDAAVGAEGCSYWRHGFQQLVNSEFVLQALSGADTNTTLVCCFRIPWGRWRGGPLVVELSDVVLCISARQESDWEEGPALRRAQAAKQAQLAAAELAKLGNRVAATGSQQHTWQQPGAPAGQQRQGLQVAPAGAGSSWTYVTRFLLQQAAGSQSRTYTHISRWREELSQPLEPCKHLAAHSTAHVTHPRTSV